MKPKRILTILLTLVFLFTSAVPALAEETELPSTPEQGETVQPSESIPVPDEDLGEGGELPDESVEIPGSGEENPPAPEIPEVPTEGEDIPPSPTEPETPGEDNEAPDMPQPPADGGEIPGEDEQPPEDGETPDEETPEEDEGPTEDEEEDPAPEEEPPVINVVVPPSGQVIINPYRMKVATSTGESTEQIVHEPQALVNLSEVPVQVDAWATGRLAGESNAVFIAAPPAESAEAKLIFMYLEFQPFPDQWTNWYDNFDNQLLVTDWGESKENVLTLPAGGEGWYRLSGAMTNFPAEMWQEEDAASVTIVFSFNPILEESETAGISEAPDSDIPEASEAPEWTPQPAPEDIAGMPIEGEMPEEPEDGIVSPGDDLGDAASQEEDFTAFDAPAWE